MHLLLLMCIICQQTSIRWALCLKSYRRPPARMISSRRLLVVNERLEECTNIPAIPSFTCFPMKILSSFMFAWKPCIHLLWLQKLQETPLSRMQRRCRLYLTNTQLICAKTSMFGCGVSVLIRFSKVQVPTSTLFSRSEDLRSGLEPLVEKARDYCSKAVSLYQGLEQYTELTLEWCDILVDVLEVSRQRDLSNGSGVTEEQCDKGGGSYGH